MRKFFIVFAPVALLTIFILIMVGGNFLKKPTGERDNVPKYMGTIEQAVLSDNWTAAEEDIGKLEEAWKIVAKRVQFSGERDEMNDLSVSLSRLKASITTKDKTSALVELGEAGQHWINLGK
jgi:hypothetical protein